MRLWRKEKVCSFCGIVNWCTQYGKQCGDSSTVLNRTTIWFSNSTSGHLYEENKNMNFKRYRHPYVYYSITYNGQDMETTSVPNLSIHNGILFSHKKNKILLFATVGMDLQGIILSEINQTETNPWVHLWVKSKKTKQNKTNLMDADENL